MTNEEAKQILKYHSFQDEDIDHPKMTRGFLGMLRPFRGEIIEENFHEVMDAIKTLSKSFRNDKLIDKQVMSSLWGICHLTRSWAIDPDGMLQQNNLLTQEQIDLLEQWIETISYSTFCFLDGCDDQTALNFYSDEKG